MALHLGHRHDALMGILEVLASFLGGDRPSLQQQYAGDDLQAVGDPVLHFAKQHILLAQQIFGAAREAPPSPARSRDGP